MPGNQRAASSFLPREHGAWGMLLLPFVSALVLAREFHWQVFPAVVAVLVVFLLRAPLVTLARQRLVWRQQQPEASPAARTAAVEALVLAACVPALATLWPAAWLALFGAGAALFTALAVWMNARNRQRAVWFQIAGAAALSATALAGSLSATGVVAAWVWWLWAAHAVHSSAAVLAVHARLEARVAARGGVTVERLRHNALIAQWCLAAGAAGCLAAGRPWLALALAASAAAGFTELRGLRSPGALDKPLRRVGWQALLRSVLFSVLVVLALW